MNSSNGGGVGSLILSGEAAAMLAEGISLVLSRWTALQMAVENQWGGRDSRSKADQLVASIQSWFIHTKPPHYIDDLEKLIDDDMITSLNAQIEDGSIEEIAEQLMVIHEECLKGEYGSVQKLKQLPPPTTVVPQNKQDAHNDSDESFDEDSSESDSMEIEGTQGMSVDQSRTSTKPVPDADGWTVVANRHNRGRRSN